jgi:uncharacterized protein (TIGR02147 family)
MNAGANPHYKELLEREYQTRLRRNSSYSLRAFARDIGMSPSKLSEVLRGIRGLSPKTAEKVTKSLNLSQEEKTLFLNLVQLHQKRNLSAQKVAEEKLKTLAAMDGYGELGLERFKIISDWHHFAILELTETKHFESDPSWIAGRLGIPTQVARDAIERLLDFGLLKKSDQGELQQTHVNLATPSGIPSRELREHHSQILMKADAALHEVDVTERDYSAITLAFHSEQMDEVRKELKELRRRLGQKIQERPNKDRVYCLAMQFFPIDKNDSSKNKKRRN